MTPNPCSTRVSRVNESLKLAGGFFAIRMYQKDLLSGSKKILFPEMFESFKGGLSNWLLFLPSKEEEDVSLSLKDLAKEVVKGEYEDDDDED